jgi:sulfatase-modifying factor enzyme 1
MMRRFAVVLAGVAFFATDFTVTDGATELVHRAEARTIGVVPKAVLRARPRQLLKPGSPGTLAYVLETRAKRYPWMRPAREEPIPNPFPDGRCPAGMADIDQRFCIDRYEASLVALSEDELVEAWPATLAPVDSVRYLAVSEAGVAPQGYVSGATAAGACAAVGKRLCQASEWRFACAGSQGTVYPYGPEHVAGRCNDHGRPPMPVFYPEVEKTWAHITMTKMNDPRLNQMEGTVAPTGSHPGCVNDWGVYDMVGNLHEWVADPNGTFQGGYYLDTTINGEGCAYRTTAHDFGYHDYSTGFRCCADRVPSADDDDEGE